MKGEGYVIARDEGFVTVRVRQSTACDGCHAKDACDSCPSYIEVRAHNDCGAEVGDKVELSTSTGRVLFYALIVFVFPLLAAAAAYFAVDAAFHRLFLSTGSAAAALAIFFLLLRFTLDRKALKRCDTRAGAIINKHSNGDDPS